MKDKISTNNLKTSKLNEFVETLKVLLFTGAYGFTLLALTVATFIILVNVLSQGSLIYASRVLIGAVFAFSIVNVFFAALEDTLFPKNK